ncbi:putative ABC transporter ATP-binding protein YknY [Leucobacter aridicollis]|uniref:ABC transporter ATP-binding protein n=1 Tax=Leucobacter aridicollis TaxID=283878 RepID=UPI000EAE336F|nr:ABC transporter ATP-binding protein [Leucobacter aridicollis]MCS3427455.1 putative ABC transport system ATP-binding protein [Leucobacter aridicollis]RKQ84397.1 putative ABC transport system ATP-binding protein [Mycolicibacterium mucogenicum 261Sha1.1M5]
MADSVTVPRPWLLSAEGLTQSFGPTHALVDADVTIFPGEAVAIMGPSGSGKSTLLHALAGIEPPNSGTVILRRTDATGSSDAGFDDLASLSDAARSALRLRRFGFVFQHGMLLPELRAWENVALPLLLAGASRDTAKHRAADELERLGLTGLEERRIGQLSGGEAQRVAIARALAPRPTLIFADEPTGALDSVTAGGVLDALLASSTGPARALLIVTHDEGVAARCDRVVRLRDGRVEARS